MSILIRSDFFHFCHFVSCHLHLIASFTIIMSLSSLNIIDDRTIITTIVIEFYVTLSFLCHIMIISLEGSSYDHHNIIIFSVSECFHFFLFASASYFFRSCP